ncbi:hypothetical protein TW65_01805 [Stemphylium lycopersici]|nr:hypothetical protein TW65_01805 [Stemphylium lycopersici]
MARMRKSKLTVPGEGTPALRIISRIWKLDCIARTTSPRELQDVWQRMRDVVYNRRPNSSGSRRQKASTAPKMLDSFEKQNLRI